MIMDDEFAKIEWLSKRLRSGDAQIPIDIGDDAAVVRNRSDQSVLTVDTQLNRGDTNVVVKADLHRRPRPVEPRMRLRHHRVGRVFVQRGRLLELPRV